MELLNAAELHGATHQAEMEFQVVTDKRLPVIRAWRSVIAFHHRGDMESVSVGIKDRRIETDHESTLSSFQHPLYLDINCLDLNLRFEPAI